MQICWMREGLTQLSVQMCTLILTFYTELKCPSTSVEQGDRFGIIVPCLSNFTAGSFGYYCKSRTFEYLVFVNSFRVYLFFVWIRRRNVNGSLQITIWKNEMKRKQMLQGIHSNNEIRRVLQLWHIHALTEIRKFVERYSYDTSRHSQK